MKKKDNKILLLGLLGLAGLIWYSRKKTPPPVVIAPPPPEFLPPPGQTGTLVDTRPVTVSTPDLPVGPIRPPLVQPGQQGGPATMNGYFSSQMKGARPLMAYGGRWSGRQEPDTTAKAKMVL